MRALGLGQRLPAYDGGSTPPNARFKGGNMDTKDYDDKRAKKPIQRFCTIECPASRKALIETNKIKRGCKVSEDYIWCTRKEMFIRKGVSCREVIS